MVVGLKVRLQVVILLVITISSATTHEKETLRLGVLVSQDGSFDNSGFLPAMDLALETIENDSSLQYRFEVRVDDSMVSVDIVAKRLAASCCSVQRHLAFGVL